MKVTTSEVILILNILDGNCYNMLFVVIVL